MSAGATRRSRWPAEWEPQSAVLLTWPRQAGPFRDYPAIHENFVLLARALGQIVPLWISVESEATAQIVRSALQDLPHPVRVHVIAANDVWVRDHGPIGVLRDGRLQLLKFRFDGWGGKYPSAADNALVWTWQQAGLWGDFAPPEEQGWTLEGGAIETDGQGTLLVTASSVADPRRNADLDRAEITARLQAALGVERVLWLEHGALCGDDTDGHIDTLARFVTPEHIVYQSCSDPEQPNFAALQALQAELATLRQLDGRPYQLTALPHTHGAHQGRHSLLPTSYANFLLLNGHLLLPQYGDAADRLAYDTLVAACPQYRIVPVDCRVIVTQYGSLHCATMNIPAETA